MFRYIINTFVQFLFLLTPFFVLSMFLSLTQGWKTRAKRKLSIKVGLAAFITCIILLFFGRWLFEVFAITVDAFRIGGGGLLFLSAVGLVNGNISDKKPELSSTLPDVAGVEDDTFAVSSIAVVPLAIPVTVGPGTIAAILVIGADSKTFDLQLGCTVSLAAAFLILTSMLFVSSWVEQKLGRSVIVILSKLTGLILSAMAAQMVFTGIRSFLVVP